MEARYGFLSFLQINKRLPIWVNGLLIGYSYKDFVDMIDISSERQLSEVLAKDCLRMTVNVVMMKIEVTLEETIEASSGRVFIIKWK